MDIPINSAENSNIKITQEIIFQPYGGCCFLILNLFLFFGSIALTAIFPVFELPYLLAISIPLLICTMFNWWGFFVLKPNEAGVLVRFGTYIGTVKQSGYFWTNPFSSLTLISLKSRNLNGAPIKVNDKIGNPIEIAIVVVWKVQNTAKALFDVENYENFVLVNSESAVRHLALSYPYDKNEGNDICLRSGHQSVIKQLVDELHERLEKAGIEVEEARVTHLAYAPEIANAMLRRQQAEAIISAREKIVQGAVSIVGHALNSLQTNRIVEMNNDEKARLVSNLLVVLCSESHVNPIVNTGS